MPVDTFAYTSQIIGIKNKVDDAVYRMERNVGQFKAKIDDNMDKF